MSDYQYFKPTLKNKLKREVDEIVAGKTIRDATKEPTKIRMIIRNGALGLNPAYAPSPQSDPLIVTDLIALRSNEPQSFKTFMANDRIPMELQIEVENRTPASVRAKEKLAGVSEKMSKKKEDATIAVVNAVFDLLGMDSMKRGKQPIRTRYSDLEQ